MKTRIRNLLIPILALGFSVLAFFGEAKAQVSSAAFDRNCYQPEVGNPNEIDTIYGAYNGQRLGFPIVNIGKHSGEPNAEIIIGGLLNTAPFIGAMQTGTNFNLHQLNVQRQLRFSYYDTYSTKLHYAHLRNSNSKDLVFGFGHGRPKIYWADSNGYFDSLHLTLLNPSVSPTGSYDFTVMDPYIAHLTSDTVDDIVIAGAELHRGPVHIPDSVYLYLYRGGKQLYDKDSLALPDEKIYVDTLNNGFRSINQGDWSGTGREELMSMDLYRNLFLFKNERPFTLEKLAESMRYDTLSTKEDNPPDGLYLYLQDALTMDALPKPSWDKSKDLVAQYGWDTLLVFRGGADFGSKRLKRSDAEATLYLPYYYDKSLGNGYFGEMYDCGDMTGTGNRVLLIKGSADAGFYDDYFFYVLGKAIDDKVDMYYTHSPYADGSVDTLTANGDNLEDVMIGMPLFYSYEDLDRGKTDVGTIHLLYGSKKIPVRLNPKYSVEERKGVDGAINHIIAFPNPCDEHTVLTFDNCTSSVMRMVVANTNGEIVLHDETPAVDGLQQFSADLSSIPAGMYVIRLTCPALGWTGSVNIVKTGAAKTPWSFDLKKMVGR